MKNNMKNILLSSFVAIALFAGCTQTSEEKQEKEAVKEVTKDVSKEVSKEEATTQAKLVEQVKQSSNEVAKVVSSESKKLLEKGSEATKEITKQAQEVATELTNEIVNKTKQTKTNIENSIEKIVETKKDKNIASKGKSLYLKCAGCHGQNGQIKALGKSQIIKGWDKQQVLDALVGYKQGTYGYAMKGVMIAQVSSMSDEDLEVLAEYIASF